jgi:hypothetical protein
MSIMRCDGCDRNIDTDYHEMEHNDAGSWCERCQEKHFEEGMALAQEHQREVIQPAKDRQDIIDAGRGHLLNDHVGEPFRSILNKFSGV